MGRNFTRFFWWAFAARVAAGLLRAVITDYIIPSWGVDTKMYFYGSTMLVDAFWTDPGTVIEVLFSDYEEYSAKASQLTQHYFFKKLRTSIIIRFGFFLNLVTAGSYLGMAFICTFIGFIGSWLTYKTFYVEYPRYGALMALSCLFLPTVVFYSTNLFKDPFCIFGLGLLIYYSFQIRRAGHSLWAWLCIALGASIVGVIKVYILAAFLIAYGVFWFAAVELPLRRGILKDLTKAALVLGGLATLAGLVVVALNMNFSRYNPTAIAMRLEYIISGERGADTGSGYSLPVIAFTPTGILYFFLAAFNTSLFRPYPWEVNGVGPLILFLESFPTLLATSFLLVRTAFINFFRQIFRDPVLLFCLTFSLIFLSITGAFSPSFGALCRYKIPGFPLFVIVLSVVAARYFEVESKQRVHSGARLKHKLDL